MHYMLLWKVPEACFVFPTAHLFCFGVWLSLFFSTGSPFFFLLLVTVLLVRSELTHQFLIA
jgi:hypothetical protein